MSCNPVAGCGRYGVEKVPQLLGYRTGGHDSEMKMVMQMYACLDHKFGT